MDRVLGSPRSHPLRLKMRLLLIFVARLFSRGVFHQGRMPQGSKGNYCDSGAEVRLSYPGRPIMFSSSGECFSLGT